jgi:tRNA-2-methylthio-N6-dimethylallyladenosine synthase
MLAMTGPLIGARLLVHYTTDVQGLVNNVWILTPGEAEKKPWPTTLQEAPGVDLRPGRAGLEQAMKKVFIKTFGCQMNEYDSDKMADVLHAAEGYEPTTDVEQADLILFNTCSVREKAQEKVFSDLGRVKHLKAKGVMIGVGRLRRQPGRRRHHRARALCRRRVRTADAASPARPAGATRAAEATAGRHQLPRDREVRHLPPARVEGATAFVSIMEGCSKYCSYCVVPYTRGEEVSRPFDDVLVEVAGLADQGVKEVTLLGQNVNAYRGAMGRTARSPTSRCCSSTWPRARHRAHPLHHEPSERVHARLVDVYARVRSWSTTCTCPCSTAATASSWR